MTNLLEKTEALMETVTDKKNKKYLFVADFGTSIKSSEKDPEFPFFRIFTPVDPEKKRKINSVYGIKFDVFEDSLMDYPPIIHHKFGYREASWDDYNRLISINVARCPLNCWHCYLFECLKNECGRNCSNFGSCDQTRKTELEIKEDWFTAKEIVDNFIKRRESDFNSGIKTNVLRITGGEPFLVPEFILEVLQELELRNLNDRVFVWTETSLIPLAVLKRDGNYKISDELLKSLSKYSNFCVHPCFHGLNSAEFEQITGEKIEDYNYLMTGFKRILNAGIDVYPSFGSNVSDPNLLEKFYDDISAINPLLPLRFALVEYSTGYDPIQKRFLSQPNLRNKEISKTKKDEQIQKWSQILKDKTYSNYADIPRQFIPIVNFSDKGNISTKTIIHLFKRPASVDYQQRFLQIVALPFNTIGKCEFSIIWLNPQIILERETINNNEIDCLFWAVDCVGTLGNFSFNWSSPIRKLRIKHISEPKQEKVTITFIMKEFVSPEKYQSLRELQQKISINFDNQTNFPPCFAKGFGFFGNSITFNSIDSFREPDLRKLNNLVHEIPNYKDPNGLTIKDYPFFFVEGIKELNLNKFLEPDETGKYNLLLRKEYVLIYSFFLSDEYRDQPIYVENEKLYGPLRVQEKHRLKNLELNQQELSLNLKSNKTEYTVKIEVNVIQSWYENKRTRLIILFIAYIISFGLVFAFLGSAELSVVIGLLLTVGIFFADKLWEVFIK